MKKIMFNDAYGLTQAVIEGRKTMTRRIEFDECLQNEACDADRIVYNAGCLEMWWGDQMLHSIKCRYKVGEVVAVAQAYDDFYNVDCNPLLFPCGAGWLNKMFVKAELMPHRIRITGIRAERLQDISDDDCLREGVRKFVPSFPPDFPIHPTHYVAGDIMRDTLREAFAALIDKVSGRGTWASNPWVVAYEYELIK